MKLRRRVTGWLRTHLELAVTALRERPRSVAQAVVAFLIRWALRISLPIGGAAAMLTLFPYHATAGGVHFRVEGSLLTHRRLSADTTFGNWVFPRRRRVAGRHPHHPGERRPRPAGICCVVRPAVAIAEQLRADLVRPASARSRPGSSPRRSSASCSASPPRPAINLAVRYVRGLPRRQHEIRLRLQSTRRRRRRHRPASRIVGVVTYEPGWARQSRMTGTLAALQLFPNQLQSTTTQHSKALDVLSAVAAIQSGLQQHIDADRVSPRGVQHHVHLRHAPRRAPTRWSSSTPRTSTSS